METNSNGTAPPRDPVLRSLREPASTPASEALGRRTRVAEELSLWARVEAAKAADDRDEERRASAALARFLGQHDRDLDVAVQLAFRALALGDDPELQFAVVKWLQAIGEFGLAAATLRKLAEAERDSIRVAQIFIKTGVLYARAGDAAGAKDAFSEAAKRDPQDALSCELAATLGSWGEGQIPAKFVAALYVEAAQRRAAAGATEPEFEDLLRAFEASPRTRVAARGLAAALARQSKPTAKDELWRIHARAITDEGGPSEEALHVHEGRASDAQARGDLPRAIGAMLDAHADAETAGPSAELLDDLLLKAQLLEPLGARLLLRAERTDSDRARAFLEAARLFAGPLASPLRAARVAARAAVFTPTPEILATLVEEAEAGGGIEVAIDGLIRGIRRAEADGDKAACARALARLAESHENFALAEWAWRTVLSAAKDDADASAACSALGEHRERVQKASAALRVQITKAPTKTLEYALGASLVDQPDQDHERLVLLESALADKPDDTSVRREALRLAWRTEAFDKVTTLAKDAPQGTTRHEWVEHLFLANLERGDEEGALAVLDPILSDLGAPEGLHALAWFIAARAKKDVKRARSLAAFAARTSGSLRATLGAIAAEALLAAGEISAARKLAEHACHADSQNPRAVATLADAWSGARDRTAASALERAIALVFPRSKPCGLLAETFEELGDLAHAVGWTQRVLALRPGDVSAMTLLTKRVLAAKDVNRAADTLGWILSQPHPAGAVAGVVAVALQALEELDQPRAVSLARRALDVLGPRHATLRDAVRDIARRAADGALSTVVLERWASAGAHADERAQIYVAIAEHHRAVGDKNEEVRALVRALRDGLDPATARAWVETIDPASLSADAELFWLEIRARTRDEDASAKVAALRQYGAALWDLAHDRGRALRAWLAAASQAPGRGYTVLARDLVAFSDDAYALECLAELVEHEPDVLRSGVLAGEAAKLALALGAYPRAAQLAFVALERDSDRAAGLEVAEKALDAMSSLDELSRLYEKVAARAKGRFGRRSAHYRGAQFFEARGMGDFALKHACAAFLAVPSEGSTLRLLVRTSENAKERSTAVRAIEQVAELSRSAGARAAWLLRAAQLAVGDPDGPARRADLLLRAAVISPVPSTLSMVRDAVAEVVREAPDERDAWTMRLARARQALLPRLEGPEGARVAVAFGEIFGTVFEDIDETWKAFETAMSTDGDIDEYTTLVPLAPLLARTADVAVFDRVVSALDRPYSNVGSAAVSLLVRVAEEMKHPRAGSLRVLSAEKEPDDPARVVAALESAATSPDLAAQLFKKVRAMALVTGLEEHAEHADPVDVEALSTRVVDLFPLEKDREKIREIADRARRAEFHAVVPASPAPPSVRPPAVTLPAADDFTTRVGVLKSLVLSAPDSDEAWGRLDLELYDAPEAFSVRELFQDLAASLPEKAKVEAVRRLARELERERDVEAAEPAWREVLRARPGDDEATQALESLLSARAAFDDLAAFLQRRAESMLEAGDPPESIRAVRLRRAALLEQRLGRLDATAAELEAILDSSPDHEGALRYLADVHERRGEHEKAVAVLTRLEALAGDDERARAEIQVRRARLMLLRGDPESARSALGVALVSNAPPSHDAVELRVALARASGDLRELGDALEELATELDHEPAMAADHLLEASQCATRSGDDDGALRRARLAVRAAPRMAATQLFARGLEYKLRGPGSEDEARATLAALDMIEDDLDADDLALRTFLYAEASEAADAPDDGLKLLEAVYQKGAPQPLVALALAERALLTQELSKALSYFEVAVRGNLLGLRRPGHVAMTAAEVARRHEDLDKALEFLNDAAKDPETRVGALRRKANILGARGDIDGARTVLLGLADTVLGDERAQILAQLGRILVASPVADFQREGRIVLGRAIEAAEPEGLFRAQLIEKLTDLGTPSVPPLTDSPRPPDAVPSAAPKTLESGPETSRFEAPPETYRVTTTSTSTHVRDDKSVPPPPPDAEPAPVEAAPAADAPRKEKPVLDLVIQKRPVLDLVLEPDPRPESAAPPPLPPVVEAAPAPEPKAESGPVEPTPLAEALEPEPPLEPQRLTAPSPDPVSAKDAEPSTVPDRVEPAEQPEAAPSGARASAQVLVAESGTIRTTSSAPTVEVAAVVVPPVTEVPTVEIPAIAAAPIERLRSLMAAVKHARTRGERTQARIQVARAWISHGAPREAEEPLRDAMEEGSIEACESLAELLEKETGRARDLVEVRRRAVTIAPGEPRHMEALAQAAEVAGTAAYVKAIEHVLAAFDVSRGGSIAPPPLSAQREHAGILALLQGRSRGPGGEAMGLLWKGAQTVFARRAATYALNGVERLETTGRSPLARLYDAALKALGAPEIPIHVRKSRAQPEFRIGLLQTPTIILSGDIGDDSARVRMILGTAISAALPENALFYGLGETDARLVFLALVGAFGPPGSKETLDASTSPLADAFLQTVPGSSQARLREILDQARDIDFALLLEHARQSGRRTGLFLAGDFGVAARTLVADLGRDPDELDQPGGLEHLCQDLPSLADLLAFALSPEYAEARWEPGVLSSRRGR